MATRKYPLEQAKKVRDGAVDRAAREVSDAVRARDEAERRAREAAREEAEAKAAAEAVREAERGALARGELTAADLARAHAWEGRAESEIADLEDRARAAGDATARAHADEARAREELGRRRADADALAKHREKWDDRVRREGEARDEEGAEEAWRPKRD
jgi:hypothetical protein